MPTYQCDKCGACCRQFIVEIDWIDVLREPKLKEVSKPFKVPPGMVLQDDDGPIENPDPYMAGALLCNALKPCQMLGEDNLCKIYPTRPNCCVGLEAGDRQCQEARQRSGLPPLLANGD
jgi:Fe-S-cluster containining protein